MCYNQIDVLVLNMSRDYSDLSGKRFANLIVLSKDKNPSKNSKWVCKCLLCGKQTLVTRPNLKSGNTKDCGCQRSNKISDAVKTHGQSRSLTWNTWHRMRRRIREGINHHLTYEGMYIDPRWHSYETFLKDMGERPSSKHTIDRIDNTKGYFKENCRWATSSEQCRNRSNNRLLTFKEKTMCLMDWSKETGLTKSCIESRLKRNWSIEDTLSLPSGAKGHSRY